MYHMCSIAEWLLCKINKTTIAKEAKEILLVDFEKYVLDWAMYGIHSIEKNINRNNRQYAVILMKEVNVLPT